MRFYLNSNVYNSNLYTTSMIITDEEKSQKAHQKQPKQQLAYDFSAFFCYISFSN
ncbi:hypothetical Protein YC6258_03081 [Gynuella sunshinyii YC6258]|uniref:Uncharacterized protein n=1 Tax=Gynuella sunshinyii YC6258 TaxID=1445510 RepID=A0A0C5VK99_9GAMM|nr:hypothetical Protein YC6258_03081 [Gynuella sunshinyii YC6258]